jgi:hypothetical protein
MISQSVLELVSFFLYTAIFFATVVFLVRMIVKNKKLRSEVVSLMVERVAFAAHIEQLETAKESESVENTQGFLRFISESRDWAFQYIEDVQRALVEYDEALNTKDAAKINLAYKKIISLLPKENEDAI